MYKRQVLEGVVAHEVITTSSFLYAADPERLRLARLEAPND